VAYFTFDQVLAELQGMIGREIVVAIQHPRIDHDPLNVIGELRADTDMTAPFDEDRFDFTVSDHAVLSISRSYYLDATKVETGLHIETGRTDHSIVIRVATLDA
jgi:hypothetical protein